MGNRLSNKMGMEFNKLIQESYKAERLTFDVGVKKLNNNDATVSKLKFN